MNPFWKVGLAVVVLVTGMASQAKATLSPVVLIAPATEPGAAPQLVLGAWDNGRWRSTQSIARRFPASARWRIEGLNGRWVVRQVRSPLEVGGEPCPGTGYVKMSGLASQRGSYALATRADLEHLA